jgi:hypothetical protein
MKLAKRLAIACAILLASLIALPFFIPLDRYIPQIEKEVSAKLKEPVSIKSIRVSVLPLPNVKIGRITVGKTDDIKVETVTVTPDIFSLLSSPRIIRSVEIDSLVLTQAAIDGIPAWSKSDASKPPQVRIESIRLVNALVRHDKASFGPFDAGINLNAKGEPADAVITTRDGKLKAAVKPDKSNYLIDISAKAWSLPIGPAVHFDELTMQGVATLKDVDFSRVSAKLYGGTVNGKASAGWQKGLQIKGAFDVNQVELKSLVPLISPGTNLSGRLDAKPVFSAAAADANRLIGALRLDAPFSVRNGVLHGVDIKQAATSLFKKDATHGETAFDQLSGQLNIANGTHRLTQLKIASGVLAADGNVTISPKKELSGRINAQVKALGTSAGVPLNVAGTTSAPVLYPTGGTMAGAAIGTVLMPGVGTGAGAKAGQYIENLFGSKPKK